jgi:hypothetical protein
MVIKLKDSVILHGSAETQIAGTIVGIRPYSEDAALMLHLFQPASHAAGDVVAAPLGWYTADELGATDERSTDDKSMPHTIDESEAPYWDVRFIGFAMRVASYAPFAQLYHMRAPSMDIGVSSVWTCHRCLTPLYSSTHLGEHLKLFCRETDYPGTMIYSDITANPSRAIRVHFIDGGKAVQFTRNLAMLGKCFVSSKDLVNDVCLYEFYLISVAAASLPNPEGELTDAEFQRSLISFDPQWCGFFAVGYMCRLKNSPEEALSAITTFPPFQRLGLGSFTLDLAYKLIALRQEHCGCKWCGPKGRCGRLAGPFSAEGDALIQRYWEKVIAETMQRLESKQDVDASPRFFSFDEVVDSCGRIHKEDLLTFLNGRANLFYCSDREGETEAKPKSRQGGILLDRKAVLAALGQGPGHYHAPLFQFQSDHLVRASDKLIFSTPLYHDERMYD